MNPRVTFFYRARDKGHSIQRLFSDIRRALPERFRQAEWHAPTQDPRPWRLLRDVIDARRYQGDLNHVTGDTTYLALGLEPGKTILTVHDLYHLERGLRGRPLARAFYRLVWVWLPVRRCARVVAISETTRTQLVRYGGVDPDAVTVIPDCYSPELEADPQPLHTDQPRLLMIGTGVNKNVPAMIRAAAGLQVHIRIIGRLTPAIRKAIDETGAEASSVHDISDAQLRAEYGRADALFFATLWEGFGMPIIEAQAVGRPVITSARPPMEAVSGGAAVLVDPVDIASMRAGLDRLLRDSELRNRLVEEGFHNAQRYTAETVAAAYARLYDDVLGSAGG